MQWAGSWASPCQVRAVQFLAIPATTVNRVVAQLLEKDASRGYIGLGMQPVHLPDSLKSTLT